MANLGRSYLQARSCAATLMSHIDTALKSHKLPPVKTALVLGSGFAELVDVGEPILKVSYSALPHLQAPKVTGHGGTFSLNRMNGELILLLNGRFHVYEGYEPIQSCFLIMVLHALGIKNVLLSNAAGGLNANFKIGDLMVIQDHINLLGLCGLHPLIGLDSETQAIGSRFLASAHLYDRNLRALFLQAAHLTPALQIQRGIYLCVSG
ncbi:MAG: purine-nucleoside phosphorylase, partial [Oligoflexales bacterium]|nr:purine-nucleoside phosphorylase [Oligoflexales bacterium]